MPKLDSTTLAVLSALKAAFKHVHEADELNLEGICENNWGQGASPHASAKKPIRRWYYVASDIQPDPRAMLPLGLTGHSRN